MTQKCGKAQSSTQLARHSSHAYAHTHTTPAEPRTPRRRQLIIELLWRHLLQYKLMPSRIRPTAVNVRSAAVSERAAGAHKVHNLQRRLEVQLPREVIIVLCRDGRRRGRRLQRRCGNLATQFTV